LKKKHFLIAGLVVAIPFLILAISQIIAASPPSGQYHPLSELWVNTDLDMDGKSIVNTEKIDVNTNISAQYYCDENGINCKNTSDGWGGGYTQGGLYGWCREIQDDRGPNTCENISPGKCNGLNCECDAGFTLTKTGYSAGRSARISWYACIKD